MKSDFRERIIEGIRTCEKERRPWSLDTLSKELGLNRSTVNYHLTMLRAEGHVTRGKRLVEIDGFILSKPA